MTPDEKFAELQRLNEGRLFRAASEELLPLLTKRTEHVIYDLIHASKEGRHDMLPTHAAKLTLLKELTDEITRKNKETNRQEERISER